MGLGSMSWFRHFCSISIEIACFLWSWQDSNLWPRRCERCVLTLCRVFRDQLNYKTEILQNSSAYCVIVEFLVDELWHGSNREIIFRSIANIKKEKQLDEFSSSCLYRRSRREMNRRSVNTVWSPGLSEHNVLLGFICPSDCIRSILVCQGIFA